MTPPPTPRPWEQLATQQRLATVQRLLANPDYQILVAAHLRTEAASAEKRVREAAPADLVAARDYWLAVLKLRDRLTEIEDTLEEALRLEAEQEAKVTPKN